MTRKPIKRFLPLTYPPKIPGVLAGTIDQSIRIFTDLQVGDFVAFYGWSGNPYRSPWSFRTPFMKLRHAEKIRIGKDSIYFVKEKTRVKAEDLSYLAALDGIEPATGEELIRVLHSMHGGGTLPGKILRWDSALIRYKNLNESLKKSEARLTPPSQDFVQIGDIQKTCRDNPAVLQ